MADRIQTKILWSGGWDSTFRLISLILANKGTVEPYYIVNDSDRDSTRMEIMIMDKIRKILYMKYPWSRSALLPTSYIRAKDIKPNEELGMYYKNLRGRGWLGTQYELFARLAEQTGISDFELTLEKETTPHKLLKGSIEKITEGNEQYYRLSPSAQDKDLLIFRYFKFPLFDVSKVDMMAIAKKAGFFSILDKTWFCHKPLPIGLSCGTCNTCTYSMEEGMARRVSLIGKLRYYLKLLLLRPGESKIYRGGSGDKYKIMRRSRLFRTKADRS